MYQPAARSQCFGGLGAPKTLKPHVVSDSLGANVLSGQNVLAVRNREGHNKTMLENLRAAWTWRRQNIGFIIFWGRGAPKDWDLSWFATLGVRMH